MRHADLASACLVDKRYALYQAVVLWKMQPHLIQESPVDFVDDFDVSGKEAGDQRHRPSLQCLIQQCMIRVAEGSLGNVPGCVPSHSVLVDEQPHQFRNREGRMCVVELGRKLLVKCLQLFVTLKMQTDHVLERT